ncbi:MAG: GntR family transcriptional regulator [Anaerococcus vaginalis]|nr:GntR family transcriptional regulator [Anaerococcus vaginalis]
MDFTPSPIKRKFIKDEAYDLISKKIISGELKPKTRIRINEMSEALGISRTPVREAILRLEDEGLILSKANRWTMVAPINIDETLNIYPIISSLEQLALKIGFSNINDEVIEELENINENIKKIQSKKNHIKILELDQAFHKEIIDLAQNSEIDSLLDGLKRKVSRVDIYFFENDSHKMSSFDEHAEIIKYLKKKDLEKALLALEKNWATTMSSLEDIDFSDDEDDELL